MSRRAQQAASAAFTSPTDGGLRRNLEGDWVGVTGTAGLQWQPTDDTNLYLRYARGYKAGGFIASANMAPGVYADPEYLNSYELGWKQTFGGRFQMNTAVFFYDYKDFQAPLSVQLPGGTFFATQFLNLDAESKGIEVETVWSPIDPVRLFVNASYVDSEITRGCCFQDTTDPTGVAPGAKVVDAASGAQTLVGNSLPNSPEVKYTVGANYTWNFTPGCVHAGGTYSFTDDLQSNVFSNPIAPRGLERDRGLPHAVERRAEPLHDHRLREERVRRGRLHPLERLVADGRSARAGASA